ncbi:zinc metalloprotease HtpX [Candidatus Berkelbacteria bacterium RBG_13_40_8]|uniref:Protease HtpX homolog n=1 Tax=Candidatus Berkelbacteria bacterium RBG_13_40_8 TaxID=1797467 RepID=A0A1F5DM49_9BACT|nr:MAG: zinc metalloprotease HtpX [Candidatus Berkelbacteria bacterium RBG_13_40_8]
MYKEIDSNKRRTVLLMGLFLIFVIGLGYLLSYIFDNYFILVIAVLIAVIQSLVSYYYSDSITLAISQAKEVPREEPFLELHRLVENLSITAGLPKPRIYVIDDSAPNAFATGRDPKHAAIAVTTGLLDKLDKVELEGVIAHELSHDGNYDIRLMTIVVVLVGVVALLSDFFLRYLWFGGGRRRDGDGGGQLQLILLIVGIAMAILAPLAATLIQLSISRKREYLADASGALLTRYPEGLASALEKISKDPEKLEVANRATAHLYIESPIKGKNVSSLFSTHPPVEDRIKRLRAMISK